MKRIAENKNQGRSPDVSAKEKEHELSSPVISRTR